MAKVTDHSNSVGTVSSLGLSILLLVMQHFPFLVIFFSTTANSRFTHVVFHDWKHATGKSGILTYHDSVCVAHKEAMISWKQYKLTIARDASIAVQ